MAASPRFTLVVTFLVTLTVMVASACTSALAPEIEDGRSAGLTDPSSGDSQTQSQTPAGPTSPADNGPANPAPGPAPGPTVPPEDEGALLGEIGTESTDLDDFQGVSTYALSTPASGMLSISVYDQEVRDTLFRKVKSYKCEKCTGKDDEHCKKDTTAPAVKYVTVNFMKSYVPNNDGYKVDDKGYPKDNANELGADAAVNAKAGMTLLNSLNLTAQGNKGKVTFADGKRPAKTGDAYEATLDLTFGDGKKYQAKLVGKVYEFPTNPEAPKCAADEYTDVTYEDAQ